MKIPITTTTKCSRCQKVTATHDDNNRTIEFSKEDPEKSDLQNIENSEIQESDLQTNIDKWLNRKRKVEKRCCLGNEDNGPNIDHEYTYVATEVPDILHVRLIASQNSRTLELERPNITMSTSFTINQKRYHLQSAILYGGDGSRGHWQSIIKEVAGYMLYSDAHVPTSQTPALLQNTLTFGTDFVYVYEEPTTNQESIDLPIATETNNSVAQQSNQPSTNAIEPYSLTSLSTPASQTKGKELTIDRLTEYIHLSGLSIQIKYVELEGQDICTTNSKGPWFYKNSKKTVVHYSLVNDEVETN